MKASELRIGNIAKPRKGKFKKMRIDDIGLLVLWENSKYSKTPPFRPVPITVEILVEFGFDKIETEGIVFYEKIINGILFITGDKNGFLEVLVDLPEQIRIQYIHQLQNIVYTLTLNEI